MTGSLAPRADARRTQRGGRAPGVVYSALSAVLMAIIAAVAITATQTPPPAIAELAPQAVQQIKDAPPEQSSELGSAAGGSGRGAPTTTTTSGPLEPGSPAAAAATTTTQPIVERARVRRCVGDPPRQTEDPQSPPCVPFWSGDNGGATARGVTANEITVAMPAGSQRTADALEAFFNKRFEFYGRTLRIERAGGGGNNCADRRSGATRVAEELQAFAALDTYGPSEACFYTELARRGVIGAASKPFFAESNELPRLHPYLWQYIMSYDRMFSAIGEMVCARLAGGKAVHSTDVLLQQKDRKFGVILQYDQRDTELRLDPLYQSLARCGVEVGEDQTVIYSEERGEEGGDAGVTDPTLATNAVLRLQSEGVTTVICLCIIFVEQYLAPAATSQNYYPEWLVSSFFLNDTNLLVRTFFPDARQRSAMMGVTFQPPQRVVAKEPAWMAAKEVDPGAEPLDLEAFLAQYRTLLLVASGIQMAGPNLTPETFEAALHRTTFPNPEDDPTMSGKVGFVDRDHTMTNDAVEWWWSEAAFSPNQGAADDGASGAMCYLDGAARRMPGRWPRGDVFFRPPCTTSP